MAEVTPERLAQAGLAVPETAARVAVHLDLAARRFGIDTGERLAAWLAQCAVESCNFRVTAENLNYSAGRLAAVWPSRFDAARAQAYARQPERIANYVYAGRLGNGPEGSGDGWRFRGRGFIQLTGRDNYAACGRGIGVDLLASPEVVEHPEYAALSAAWFWGSRKLSELADRSEIDAISRRVNGGSLGLEERRAYYRRALPVFALVDAPPLEPAPVPSPQLVKPGGDE